LISKVANQSVPMTAVPIVRWGDDSLHGANLND